MIKGEKQLANSDYLRGIYLGRILNVSLLKHSLCEIYFISTVSIRVISNLPLRSALIKPLQPQVGITAFDDTGTCAHANKSRKIILECTVEMIHAHKQPVLSKYIKDYPILRSSGIQTGSVLTLIPTSQTEITLAAENPRRKSHFS